MKKYFYILPVISLSVFVSFLVLSKVAYKEEEPLINMDETVGVENTKDKGSTSLANPASVYCEENEGELEIVTNTDGSQIGMCQFENYACEEWVYMNSGCTIEEDAEKIKGALIAKGLDLTDMQVVITKHLGKYIGGGVVPVSAPAGGGYVFAVKDGEGKVDIVADGNGAIMCSLLEDYPDLPLYLVAECIDEAGTIVTR